MTSEPPAPPWKPIVLPAWIVDAADLLAEPDPGPTPWLVENLIVDQALVAAVGRWKTTKSYALLDVCISIATGRPAFGHLEIPNPGPVVFVNEESGRTALRRRLDHLCRGRDIEADELRGQLHVSANARMLLDDAGWQDDLLELGRTVRPRLFVFDPLARMKSSARDENAQTDMAPLIEYLRILRDETGAAVLFVHHTGHNGERMRGSSDLESAWETRLTWKRDGQDPVVEIEAEHREAESSPPTRYRIEWDSDEQAMCFPLEGATDRERTTHDRIIAHLTDHPGSSQTDIEKAIGGRPTFTRKVLKQLETAGTGHRAPSEKRDGAGRRVTFEGWYPASPDVLWPVPPNGTEHHEQVPQTMPRPASPSLKGDGASGTGHETDGERALSDISGTVISDADELAYLESLEANMGAAGELQ